MPETIEISVPFTAICVDDTNKPQEIPQEKWVKKNQEYTVIGVAPSLDGKLGFKLKEIVLGKESYPFGCFSSVRFGIPIQDKSKTLEEELADLGIEVQELELEKV